METKEKLFCQLDGKYYTKMGIVRIIKNSEMCEKDLIETISSQALLSHEGRFNDYPFIGVGNKSMISEVLGTPSGS